MTSDVVRRIVPSSSLPAGSNAYVEIGFRGTAGVLKTGDVLDALVQLHRTDFGSTLNQTNDYSFDASKTKYVDSPNVTLYRKGILIWGTPGPLP